MGRGSLQPQLPADAEPPALFARSGGAVAAGPPRVWPDGTHGKRWIPQGSGEPGARGSWPDTAPTAAGFWGSHPGLRSHEGDIRGRPVLLRAPERNRAGPRGCSAGESGRTPLVGSTIVEKEAELPCREDEPRCGLSALAGRAEPVVPPANTAQARSRVGSSGPGQGPSAARPAPHRGPPAGLLRSDPPVIHSTDTFGSDLGVRAPAHESGSERVSSEQGRPVGLCCRA